ncbi:hypothetical protein [Halorientalis sp. IM1011]|uniref:DUF7315 family membrane protein n=1 Tax=Halorientalis sp. IM1011 TaxID=1932360 RepID=UPI00267C01C0
MTSDDQLDPSETPTETAPDDPADGSDGPADRGVDHQSSEDESADRDVEVPMRVYKAITVFTTLFAIVTVVGGFVVLDSATNRATASLSEIQPLAALAGIGLILAGAAAYAFSTRFRAEGMGKSKDDTDEQSDNG